MNPQIHRIMEFDCSKTYFFWDVNMGMSFLYSLSCFRVGQ